MLSDEPRSTALTTARVRKLAMPDTTPAASLLGEGVAVWPRWMRRRS